MNDQDNDISTSLFLLYHIGWKFFTKYMLELPDKIIDGLVLIH